MFEASVLTSLGITMMGALLLLSGRACRCGGLTDALEEQEEVGATSGGGHIIRWNELEFNKAALAADIMRLADQSDFDLQLQDGKYRQFGPKASVASPSSREPSLLAKLGEAVRGTLAPVAAYLKIAARYRNWLTQYKRLVELASRRGPLKPALEVLVEEYAKADELLRQKELQSKCAGEAELDTETVDFIFRVLAALIERLEWRLDTDKKTLGYSLSAAGPHGGGPAELPDDAGRVQHSMERVKQVAMRTVARQLMAESLRIARIATFNKLASAMANNDYPQNEIRFYVSKIVAILGDADTSLAVSYLLDVQFRAALLAVRHVNLKRFCQGL